MGLNPSSHHSEAGHSKAGCSEAGHSKARHSEASYVELKAERVSPVPRRDQRIAQRRHLMEGSKTRGVSISNRIK